MTKIDEFQVFAEGIIEKKTDLSITQYIYKHFFAQTPPLTTCR